MPNHYTYNRNTTGITPRNTNTAPATLSMGEETQSTDFPKIEEIRGNTLDLESVGKKMIQTSFGRDEDYVELHIYNNANQLVLSEQNFQDYILEREGNKTVGLIVDAEQILANKNFSSGQYKLMIHVFRNKIFNTAFLPFHTKEISVSRREIKSVVLDADN